MDKDLADRYPKISIVTPSYNQGKYLEKTILSVIEQGYPDLEYIIIDGGSTDESVEIIRKYEKHLAYWVSEPDRGQSHAINKGFARATGEIFGWLNSDDWYHPGTLQTVAEAFAANPDAGAVVGAGEMLYEETGKVNLVEPFPVTLESLYRFVDRYFCQPSCLFTREAWQQCGPLDESLHLAMDLDLWLRIAKKFVFVPIPENLSVSLVHADAKTHAQAPKSIVDACLVINRHGGSEGRDKLISYVEELSALQPQLWAAWNELKLMHGKLGDSYKQLNETNTNLQTAEQTCVELSVQLNYVEHSLSAMEQSLSWKLTEPVRKIVDKCLMFCRKP
ncbi:glycosyltransferase family 2 protein [Geobacter argillaceus]|uniref:Glycosyl transferase family 2 n=1 Tax=Geobacter argillaceus TaxID=345631 RepID=A0A562WS28_9BACT|nr:glycosyltransferase family 2 protein [Geobacter argillaceus]TWJ33024.1 glycosyl transferase family 2 [Geobacter argillaceus]